MGPETGPEPGPEPDDEPRSPDDSKTDLMTMPSDRIRWRMTVRPETWDRDSLMPTNRIGDDKADHDKADHDKADHDKAEHDKAEHDKAGTRKGEPQHRDPRFERFTWLDQVHGTSVVTVRNRGEHRGAVADAAVTDAAEATLVIRTADCAPILFEGADSVRQTPVLGLAHGGWKGLIEGVVPETVKAMQAIGAQSIRAWLGPCIGVECYEFGGEPLAKMVERFGPAVRGLTRSETPALNMVEVVSAAVQEAGATYAGLLRGWTCTACDSAQRYSHRARKESGRMALIAQIVPVPADDSAVISAVQRAPGARA